MPFASLRKIAKALRGAEDGAVAIEFAIISVALVLGCFGTIEFGRALEVRNQLAFVADRASRQVLTDASVPEAELESRIREWFDAPDAHLLEVDLGTEIVDGIEFRTVALRYPFVLMIPQLSSRAISLTVEQRIPVT